MKDEKIRETICSELQRISPNVERLRQTISQGVLEFVSKCGVKRLSPRLVTLTLRSIMEIMWKRNAEVSPGNSSSSSSSSTSSSVASSGGTNIFDSTPAKEKKTGKGKGKRGIKKRKETPIKVPSKSDDKVAEKWSDEGKRAWEQTPKDIREAIWDLAEKHRNDLEDFTLHYINDFDGNWVDFQVEYD